jgi:thioredoxin 1
VSDQLESVSDARFSAQVEAASEPYLVEFTTPLWSSCAALEPILVELAHEWAGRLRIGQMDISTDPSTAERFGVRTAPTMLLFRDGEPVRRLMGAKNKRNLVEALSEYLPGP